MSNTDELKVTDDVRAITEILWSFHNDRLKDPSINEMKPYIQPMLDLIASQRNQILQEVIDELDSKLDDILSDFLDEVAEAKDEGGMTDQFKAIDEAIRTAAQSIKQTLTNKKEVK